ncbi:neutral/alkaline non-lysosomal ceramidase N-terminal domain-containing protein [Gynuella sunshinyii]|uniref:Neutral ceramidase n=1 Tax=Gynuella sunshinyii YC6258 TaxID=1445510 RepID=A0A0C5VLV5_9GAMM|nr:neutral/alkaline non-lysosomal ceramidase N-terminal domain-containing protein [Gynuella sunshinyii]AJQ94333.1 hypothetical Protein YC6258_02295 [Gynuella sunshinyii YC6258]
MKTSLSVFRIFASVTLAAMTVIVSGYGWSVQVYQVGAGKADITGPFVASSTGYNSPGDEMSGLTMRLYSRAFVIEQPDARMVAIVTADQLHMYQSVKLGVISRLQALGYGDRFDDSNVLLSATHTHSATSNTSWYTLFNLFNGVIGFDRLHYQVVVEGITRSIIDAYDARRPATIRYAEGEVINGVYNRSSLAYGENHDADQFASNVDNHMRLLRFDGLDGSEIGLLNWFAVHGTSLGIDNHRIHGDNKGWAAYRFEQLKGNGFVAAFAQGAVGDSSPNIPDPDNITHPFLRPADLDPTLDAMENPIVAGNHQYEAALSLYQSAGTAKPVTVDYRHTYVNFNQVAVQQDYIQEQMMPWDTDVADNNASTCVAVIGAGFLAGDEEGAPVDLAAEGEIKNRYLFDDGTWVQQKYDLDTLPESDLGNALGALWPIARAALKTDQYDACQKEKFALLPVGNVDDYWFPNPNVPFVPVDIPLQVIRIGDLAVLATPFEMTTMTGRRLRQQLADTLAGGGVNTVVLAGMANSYGQYLTTREEYAAQHFEGAFTLYGPWEMAAVAQELDRISADMVAGRVSQAGPTPPDLSDQQLIQTWISSNGVVTDGGDFGAVQEDAHDTYSAQRDIVTVSFRAAHPRTILEKKMDGSLTEFYDPEQYSFLEIQRQEGQQWITVARDTDPYTSFDWTRDGGPNSLSDRSTATVTWLVRGQTPGLYRIKYNGLAKRWMVVTTVYEAFSGYSSAFELY